MKKLNLKNRLLLEFGITALGYILLVMLMRIGVLKSYWQGILITICINVILTVSLNMTAGFLGELALGHAGFMAAGAYASAVFTKSMRLLPVIESAVSLRWF